jgi:hypothetical protein
VEAEGWRRLPALQAWASAGASLDQRLLNAFVAGYAMLRSRPELATAALTSGEASTEAALVAAMGDLILWLVRADGLIAADGLPTRLLDAYRTNLRSAVLEGCSLAVLERRSRRLIAAALASELEPAA